MKEAIIAAIAALTTIANIYANAQTARPNCYIGEVRILTACEVQTDDGEYAYRAYYTIDDGDDIYAMDGQDFLPGDHCVGLICDNNTPDDVKDDFYIRVIKWID